MRRTKILATLGPSSQTVDQIEAMIRAGMNAARINMGHGDDESRAQLIKNIRDAAKRCGTEVAILLDLQGPKIRVDKLKEPLHLKQGEEWSVGTLKSVGGKGNAISTIYENLVNDVKVGDRILFDDGLIVTTVIKISDEVATVKVEVGGILKSNKGINLPDSKVSAESFTEKDQHDFMNAIKLGVDYIALSFVKKKEDVQKIKYLLHELKFDLPIISKIESPEGIENIEGILEMTDMVMVARGDLGVELGNHKVPSVQKQIINMCNNRGIPVITATQMLESMMNTPSPTRAEASDVANAVWDGTDVVMLSGETAAGKYPLEAIKVMDQIIVEAEKKPKVRPHLRHVDLSSVTTATMVAASIIAEKLDAKKILVVTQTGTAVQRLTRFRPLVPIIGVTNNLRAARRIALMWGASTYYLKNHEEDNLNVELEVIEYVRQKSGLKNGDKIVIARGEGRFFSKGSSANSVKVEIIKHLPKREIDSTGLSEVNIPGGKIMHDQSLCASCQKCIHICPHEIFKLTKDENRSTYIDHVRAPECSMDMQCVAACPSGAIEIMAKTN